MDSSAPAVPRSTSGPSWRAWAVVAALVLAVWWVLRSDWVKALTVPMTTNSTPPPEAPPGVPPTLAAKMARVVDSPIPVVMTSGASVPHDEDDVAQVVRAVLARLNAMDESVSLISVVNASKTQDSYKTVAYEATVNAYDAKDNVALTLAVSVLVPVSGKVYVRKLQHFNAAPSADAGPPGLVPGDTEFAAYEDPATVLAGMRVA